MIDWIQFGICAALIASGILVLFLSVTGVFRLKFALNRIHFAGMTDTLGLFLIIAGLIVASGFTYTSLKLLAILFFLWFTSPVCSHFLGKLEYETDPTLPEQCEVLPSEEDIDGDI